MAIAAKGEADADPDQEAPDCDLGQRLVEERELDVGKRREGGAERERQARAEARAEPARQRPGAEHDQRAGQHQQARDRRRLREAVAGDGGQLDELRDQHVGAEHREADRERREVRRPHRALRHQLHVDHRLGARGARR